MSDEMKRLDRLNMENLGLPYFLAYTVRDTRRVEVSASFGALKEFDDSRYRRVSLDLRVGSSLFDNTHYIPRTPGTTPRPTRSCSITTTTPCAMTSGP